MLWMLSEVYYPEETGTGYYITRIAEHLALSQPVSVLCAQPAYSRAGVKAPCTQAHRGVHIFRCPSIILHQRAIWTRLTRMVSITLSMLFTGLFRIKRGDSIMAGTCPPSLPVLAAVLSFVLRVPYSLIVYDVYPDIIAACGLTSRRSVSYRALQKINRLVLRGAKNIFCIGRDMLDHLALARGMEKSDGIEVIPLWSDCEEIRPSPKESNPLLLELGLSDKLVVLYAGDMGFPHGIETLAAAIKSLESEEDIHFIFMGSGPKQKILLIWSNSVRGTSQCCPLVRGLRKPNSLTPVTFRSLRLCLDAGACGAKPNLQLDGGGQANHRFGLGNLRSIRGRARRTDWMGGRAWRSRGYHAGNPSGKTESGTASRDGRESTRTSETRYLPENILRQFDVFLSPQLAESAPLADGSSFRAGECEWRIQRSAQLYGDKGALICATTHQRHPSEENYRHL